MVDEEEAQETLKLLQELVEIYKVDELFHKAELADAQPSEPSDYGLAVDLSKLADL